MNVRTGERRPGIHAELLIPYREALKSVYHGCIGLAAKRSCILLVVPLLVLLPHVANGDCISDWTGWDISTHPNNYAWSVAVSPSAVQFDYNWINAQPGGSRLVATREVTLDNTSPVLLQVRVQNVAGLVNGPTAVTFTANGQVFGSSQLEVYQYTFSAWIPAAAGIQTLTLTIEIEFCAGYTWMQIAHAPRIVTADEYATVDMFACRAITDHLPPPVDPGDLTPCAFSGGTEMPFRRGTIADGKSSLYVALTDSTVLFSSASHSVTYSVLDGDGTLSDPRFPDVQLSSVTLDGVRASVEWVIYNPPSTFDRDSSDYDRETRFITIVASENIYGGSWPIPIELHRTPVVLAHGIWSNAGLWPSDIWNEKRFPGYRFYPVDYPADAPFTAGAAVLENATEGIRLAEYEQRGISCESVDLVAHSMGGLASRAMISRGDNSEHVRRLITITTPHHGSDFANLLMAVRCVLMDEERRCRFDQGLAEFPAQLVPWPFPKPASALGHPGRGAVEYLQEGAQGAIAALPACPVPAIALDTVLPAWGFAFEYILMSWVSFKLFLYDPVEGLTGDLRSKVIALMRNQLHIDELFDGQPSDGIVARPSQDGGNSVVRSLSNGGNGYFHIYSNKNAEAADLVTSALREPAANFGAFPSPSGAPFQDMYIPGCPSVCDPSKAAPRLNVTVEPPIVQPGQEVTVTVTGQSGYTPEAVFIGVPGGGSVVDNAAPFAYSCTVMPDSTDTVVPILVSARNASQVEEDEFLLLPMVVAATVTGLTAQPQVLSLAYPTVQSRIAVTASCSDGLDRDWHFGILGTRYVSLAPDIVEVDEDGMCTAIASGTCDITVEYGGLLRTVHVTVGSQFGACLVDSFGCYVVPSAEHCEGEYQGNGTLCSSPTSTVFHAAPNSQLAMSAAPNPFNPQTEISFLVASQAHVTLEIYDVRGCQICILFDGPMEPGRQSVHWSGRGGDGNRVASGVYVAKLAVSGVTATARLVMLK